jgi:hypothetical protein
MGIGFVGFINEFGGAGAPFYIMYLYLAMNRNR